MPTISRFFGISIRMYRDDHEPAHFHAYYAEYSAKIGIETLEVLAGRLPRRAFVLVLEWALLHRPELRDNWQRARRQEPAVPIAPLGEEA
jgi:hypothetical protein